MTAFRQRRLVTGGVCQSRYLGESHVVLARHPEWLGGSSTPLYARWLQLQPGLFHL